MSQVIVFTGLQASGKTTYYKREYIDTHLRLSLDMLNGSRSKEEKLLDVCISGKIPCVVDNTNLTIENRQIYIQKFLAASYEIQSLYFNSSLELCIERNESRTDRNPVPRVALLTGSKKLVKPDYSEGFDQITIATLDSVKGEYQTVDI